MAKSGELRVAVIGAGPAGIGAGHELLRQGVTNFTIFEKQDAAGGTWRWNRYPGLACDVWAHSYTYSYRLNPHWSANFVPRIEIERYLQDCFKEFGLQPHCRFNTNVTSVEFQSDKTWKLSTEAGEEFVFDAVINAMGGQHTPIYPDVPGMDKFEGDQWHSTHWNHDVAYANKRIVVVGSAAAAVQIVPRLADHDCTLTVLQRTPNWIMPRNWKPYSLTYRHRLKQFPFLIRLLRFGQGLLMGTVHEGVTLGHKRMEQYEARALNFINESFPDETIRDAVTPKTSYGCKRGLVSDEFYPALNQPHVELVPEGLVEVRPHSIVTESGREIEADIIVYCTGYSVMDFDRINVVGLGGRTLSDVMHEAPHAYVGIAAPEFPNYFFATGPNGLPINVSYFWSVERNLETIVDLLKASQQKGLGAIAVKEEVARAYNEKLLPRFEKYSWGNASCNSYYRTPEGHTPFLFPGPYKEYEKLHKQCSLDDFQAV
ncbi:MAG: NAD(P)/FAD-dependent oxidoreductase [Pseudomonadota bacterium]